MKTAIKGALSACVLAAGLSLPAAIPANSQVVLQFGEQPQTDRQELRRANRIENRGDNRAERAADNGNYAKAARIDRRSERRADAVREGATESDAVIQLRID